MVARDGYSLPGTKTAQECYSAMSGSRENVCSLAEELAEITIPSLFPPEEYREGDKLYVSNQSHNAMCVNNLANVLMYTGLPPGQPMVAYSVLEHKLSQQEQEDPELWSKVTLALSRLENVHRKRMETTALRSTLVEYIKQLEVAGNALWEHTELDNPVYWSMRHYVVKRDKLGRPRYVVLKRCIPNEDMAPEHLAFCCEKGKMAGEKPKEEQQDIYTCCRWEYEGDTNASGAWWYWQETEDGRLIPGTEAKGDEDIPPPLYPGGMIRVPGHNWYRAYCEEYRGDLYIVENDEHALNDGAAIASFSIPMVDPAGTTMMDDLREADNLDWVSGRADDVTMFRAEKGNDFQQVAQHADKAGQRLARVFLLNLSIQRQGERVTREEIIRMSQDLDRALGGIHTQFAQGSLRHIIMRFMWLHEQADADVPKLSDLAGGKLVRVAVVTGVDALGRSVEEENLISFATTLSNVIGPEKTAEVLSPHDFARRLAAAKGIKPEGLVKDEKVLAAEQEAAMQQAQQAQMMQAATGPVAGEAAKAIGQMAVNNQQAA